MMEFLYLGRVAKKCVDKTGVFINLTKEERDITCGYAGKDVACPTGGCVGISVNFPGGPEGFVANDHITKMNPPSKLAMCFMLTGM
jgi:hypothetical protein